jgi:hypothetical protein
MHGWAKKLEILTNMVDGNGRVLADWVGKLSPDREKQVLAML